MNTTDLDGTEAGSSEPLVNCTNERGSLVLNRFARTISGNDAAFRDATYASAMERPRPSMAMRAIEWFADRTFPQIVVVSAIALAIVALIYSWSGKP